MKNLKMVKHEPATRNMAHHIATMLRYMLGRNVVIVSLSSSPDVPTTGILVPPQRLSQRYNLFGS